MTSNAKKSGTKSKDENGPPSEMKQVLQGLGVKKTQKMAEVLAENGIETRKDLAALDEDLRKELDTALKDGGVSIGDRAKMKKAQVEVNEVEKPIGNATVSVPQLVPGQAMQIATKLERVFLGMGWSGKGAAVDVDASCVAFAQGSHQELIYFQNLRNPTQSCVHTGDVLSGADDNQKKDMEDMERIYVWLQKLPSNVDCLVFVANVFSTDVNFANIEKAYVRLVNADTNQELCRVPLSGGGLKGNCLVFCKLYRSSSAKGGKGPSPWQVLSLGMPTNVAGSTAVTQMIPMLQNMGVAHTPSAAGGADSGAGGAGKPKGKGKGAGAGKGAVKGAAAGGAPPPEKVQKPRSILPCVALAVAGTAGIAAATAIYMNPELTADMMNSEVYTSGIDFSADALEWSGDALVGAGDILGEGAGDVYGWAGSVIEDVDVPGMDSIGDGLGTAAGYAGEGLQFGLDGAPVAGDAIMDAGQGAAGWIADGENWENAGGAIQGAGGAAADWAGDGQNWQDAGGAVYDGAEGAAGYVTDGQNWENGAGYAADAGGAIYEGGGAAVDALGDANIAGGLSECCMAIFGFASKGGADLVGEAIKGLDMDTE